MNMTSALGKKLSAILLCRNERKQIEKCLDSLVRQDFPVEDLELLIVDGMSDDGTREILARYVEKHPHIRVVDNPDRVTPYAFNVGIRNAKGDAILILNGHSIYPPEYFSKNINALFELGVDNVGGKQVVIPRSQGRVALAIAAALGSSLGAGTPEGKGVNEKEVPTPAETVVYGCYRREVFEKIGLFDERLLKGQDVEFNLRLLKNGGRILRIPGIYCNYMTRSTLRDVARYYYVNGKWLLYPLRFGIRAFRTRHLAPLVLVLGFIAFSALGFVNQEFLKLDLALFASYLSLLFLLGIKTSWRARRVDFIFLIPLITGIIHFTAGWGSVVGALGAMGLFAEGPDTRA